MKPTITQPCTESWDQMAGDERSRHCAKCNLFVHHLSEMTQGEVEALLELAKTERVCVRLCRRDDGSILTKSAPSYWQAAEDRARKTFGTTSAVLVFVGAVGFAIAASVFASRGPATPAPRASKPAAHVMPPPQPRRELMGVVLPDPVPLKKP